MTAASASRVLVFRAGGRRFGVGATGVEMLVHGLDIAPVPLAPPVVLGLTSHRGGVATVFDAARCLGLSPLAGCDKLHLFIVSDGDSACLEVDAVDGVFDVDGGGGGDGTEHPGTAVVDGERMPIVEIGRILDPAVLAGGTGSTAES